MRDIGNIIKVEDLNELSHKAAEIIICEGEQAIIRNGRFMLALSGGRTPQPVYKLLSSAKYNDRIDWSKVYVFFTDERCVPPNHFDSNYGMVKKLLLDHVPVKHVFWMYDGTEKPGEAALAYEETIKGVFNLATGETPKFDLMLLGLGEDGHVASLFPSFKKTNSKNELVVVQFVEKLNAHRITMTFNIINQALRNILIIKGELKIGIMNRLRYEDGNMFPVSKIDFITSRTSWIVV